MPTPDNANPATISPVKNEAELLQALAIREVVFIEEQHVPETVERDAEDAKAFHVLAIQGGHAVGTGRLVMLTNPPDGRSGQWAQIGRMAVLKSARKAGVGSGVLQSLEDEARRRNVKGVLLHAQLIALEFYQRHGYEPFGEQFEEAGMPHLQMQKML